jgi:hypothetical protein
VTGPRELPVSGRGLRPRGRPRAPSHWQPEGKASAQIARRPPAADAETEAFLVVEHDLGFIIMHTVE